MELGPPIINFQFFNEHGLRVDDAYHPDFDDIGDELLDMYELHEKVIQKLGVEKPTWFIDAESEANQFLDAIGLSNPLPVVLLKEGKLLDKIGMRDLPSTVASCELTNVIFVRKERIEHLLKQYGHDFAIGGLVHEFTHGTAPRLESAALRRYPGDDTTAVLFRLGLSFMSQRGQLGSFMEEGFAEYLNGLYKRRYRDPAAPMISINGPPSADLPRHYSYTLNGSDKPELKAGPDGYAIELIAYCLESIGAMSGEEFIENLITSRHPDTATQAFRKLAWAINTLEPGLYKYLRDLPPDAEAPLLGMNRVLSAISSRAQPCKLNCSGINHKGIAKVAR